MISFGSIIPKTTAVAMIDVYENNVLKGTVSSINLSGSDAYIEGSRLNLDGVKAIHTGFINYEDLITQDPQLSNVIYITDNKEIFWYKHDVYELLSHGDLPIKENFSTVINEISGWSNRDGDYYIQDIFHNLESDNVVVVCYNTDNENVLISYKILDTKNIRIFSHEKRTLKVVINYSGSIIYPSGGRDYSKNPLVIETETTGILHSDRIDPSILRKTDIQIKDNFNIIINANDLITQEGDYYVYTVNHNLNTANLIINFYNTSNQGILLPYQIIDKNNIKVFLSEKNGIKVIISHNSVTLNNGITAGTQKTNFEVIQEQNANIRQDTNNEISLPKGSIILWSGNKNDIPSGWQLCDGTNNTLDLSDNFINNTNLAISGNEQTNLTDYILCYIIKI